MMEKAIRVKGVSKTYKLYNNSRQRIFDLLTPKNLGESFFALKDISFDASKGDIIGFVGINGSGKSTLSNIVAGIVPETSGTVEVNGQTSLIAVASGLKGNLTGRDNIELKCLMLGFSRDEIKQMEPDIIEFSELEKFIDQPVKSYSSGMKSRLGFAISVTIDPDILIIDEALSVGDKAFAEKSFNKMMEFKEKRKTMIFVSHSIGQMKKFCEKILWLEFGKIRDFGSVDEVIPKYEEFLSQWKNMSRKEREIYKNNVLEGDFSDGFIGKQFRTNDNEFAYEINTQYAEEPTSRLGHIRSGQSYFYGKPSDQKGRESSESYKNSVYYIKKQAVCKDELFYLLSNKPSAQEGVIGWMKASNVSSHSHVAIDNDSKTFYIKGTGAGYNCPWGGKENLVYNDLKTFENAEFNVDKTVTVGKNLWYRGMLNGEQIWVHHKFLTQAEGISGNKI